MIAESAQVSVRLVQYYFGTKDRLLADTLAHIGAETTARVEARFRRLGPSPTPRDAISAIFEEFLPVDRPRRDAMLVFITFRAVALTDPTLAASETLGLGPSLISVIEQLLESAVAAGLAATGMDPKSEAILLAGAMTGIANEVIAGGIPPNEARHYLDYAIHRAIPNNAADPAGTAGKPPGAIDPMARGSRHHHRADISKRWGADGSPAS
jgi:TetR/AcrR family transcriptional repressor of bet genes